MCCCRKARLSSVAVRLTKPWRGCSADAFADLPGQLGVFELADAAGRTIYIGCADAGSLFGLRSAVGDAAGVHEDAESFRVEVTTAYDTRWRELLMAHHAEHGVLPCHNTEPPGLGRLSPA